MRLQDSADRQYYETAMVVAIISWGAVEIYRGNVRRETIDLVTTLQN